MAAVEPVVAAQIERDVKPLLQAYFGKWGAYPFAVPFAGPPPGPPTTQPAYQGASNQTVGMLPVTTDSSFYKWASATVTTLVGQGSGTYSVSGGSWTISPSTCTINPSPLEAVCEVNYLGGSDDRPNIRVEIALQNKDKALADIPAPFIDPWNLGMVDGTGTTLGNPPPYGPWSSIGFPPSPVPTSGFSAQTGVLTYTGRLRNADGALHRITITIPLPPANYLPGLTARKSRMVHFEPVVPADFLCGLAWLCARRRRRLQSDDGSLLLDSEQSAAVLRATERQARDTVARRPLLERHPAAKWNTRRLPGGREPHQP